MAAVVSQGPSVPITRPLGSVATPVLSSSQTMCTDFDNTENIDSFVKQQIRFGDCPRVFESSSSWKAVQSRPKKKRRRFTPDHPEYVEAICVATEDATLAVSDLPNAVRNELNALPRECSYLCNSDIGCVKCYKVRASTSVPATEIAWIADTGSAHDLVSRHMLRLDEVSQSSNPVSLLTDQAKSMLAFWARRLSLMFSMTAQPSCRSVNAVLMPDGASTGPLSVGPTSRNLMIQR